MFVSVISIASNTKEYLSLSIYIYILHERLLKRGCAKCNKIQTRVCFGFLGTSNMKRKSVRTRGRRRTTSTKSRGKAEDSILVQKKKTRKGNDSVQGVQKRRLEKNTTRTTSKGSTTEDVGSTAACGDGTAGAEKHRNQNDSVKKKRRRKRRRTGKSTKSSSKTSEDNDDLYNDRIVRNVLRSICMRVSKSSWKRKRRSWAKKESKERKSEDKVANASSKVRRLRAMKCPECKSVYKFDTTLKDKNYFCPSCRSLFFVKSVKRDRAKQGVRKETTQLMNDAKGFPFYVPDSIVREISIRVGVPHGDVLRGLYDLNALRGLPLETVEGVILVLQDLLVPVVEGTPTCVEVFRQLIFRERNYEVYGSRTRRGFLKKSRTGVGRRKKRRIRRREGEDDVALTVRSVLSKAITTLEIKQDAEDNVADLLKSMTRRVAIAASTRGKSDIVSREISSPVEILNQFFRRELPYFRLKSRGGYDVGATALDRRFDRRVAKAVAIAKVLCPRCTGTNFIELDDVAPEATFSCQKCKLRFGLSTEASPRNLALENATRKHFHVGEIDLSDIYQKWSDVRKMFGHGEADDRENAVEALMKDIVENVAATRGAP